MGKLTEKEVIEGFKIDNALLGENESGTVERNNIAIKCIEELQEYRSICDSPEKLKVIDELYLERCEEINRLNAELAEYKKLEDEGLLLRLPCKVGDKVYNLIPRVRKTNDFREDEINTIRIYNDSVYIFFKNGLAKDIRKIGKTVFFTKEEAKQALERMKEVQDVN